MSQMTARFQHASSPPRQTAALIFLAFALCLAVKTARLAEPPAAWFTDAALERQRRLPVSLNWVNKPIRQSLTELARAQQVAILLDRRIVPGRTIDLAARQVALDDLLEQIGEKTDGASSWLDSVAYIGPRPAALRLRTLAALRAADLQALPKEARAVFLAKKPWLWGDLTESRQLLAELAAEAHVELNELDLPHDLWPAANLPPLSWIDRLTLLANEFDLTFQVLDGAHVRLVPIEEPVVIERGYPAGKQGKELAARWKEMAPNARIELARGKLIVRGRVEDHERLATPKPPPPPAAGATTRPGAKVYTLAVSNQPLAAVLNTLRASSIKIDVDEAGLAKAGLSVDRRVTFSVQRVTLEELLRAALKPAGLSFRRQGDAYQITPAPDGK